MTKRRMKPWAALAVIGMVTAWPHPTFAEGGAEANIIGSTKADVVVSQMRK